MLQYRIFSDIGEGRHPPLPSSSSSSRVPKNPADRNSKGEAMRNEPSELVRVVTRCALCLGSRAGPILLSPSPGRSRALISVRCRVRERGGGGGGRRRTGDEGSERVREHLENDQPSGQRALGAASRYYLKEVLYICTYRYIYSRTIARVSRERTGRYNIYYLTAAVLYKELTDDFYRPYSRDHFRASYIYKRS